MLTRANLISDGHIALDSIGNGSLLALWLKLCNHANLRGHAMDKPPSLTGKWTALSITVRTSNDEVACLHREEAEETMITMTVLTDGGLALCLRLLGRLAGLKGAIVDLN